jgi:hypothetical protein
MKNIALLLVSTLVLASGCGWDPQPLEIVGTLPASGAVNFPTDGRVSIEFNQEIDADTVTPVSFVVARKSDGVPISGKVTSVGSTALFSPISALEGGITYVATVTTEIYGMEGDSLLEDQSWEFTTLSPLGRSIPIVALMDGQMLVRFNSLSPDRILSESMINGLPEGDRMMAIDFNPADKKLYGLSSSKRMYRIDVASGAVTALGSDPVVEGFLGPVGFDVEPGGRSVRIVGGESGTNLMFDLYENVVSRVDPALENVSGIAYSNNAFEHAFHVLYGIDTVRDMLVRVDPGQQTTGNLITVGPLGVDTSAGVGLDISASGDAYASLVVGGGSIASLFKIDLETGEATYVGRIPLLMAVSGIAIEP